MTTMESTEKVQPRLKARYRAEIKDALHAEFNYANVMQIPGVVKVVVNMGVGDAARDAKLLSELKPLEQRYLRRVIELKGTADARLADFRWQLEELRVSLFAQELRTPQPVSVKRLDKVWAQLQG